MGFSRVLMPGEEEEAVRVRTHRLVVGEAEHDGLAAAGVGAFAYEGHPLACLEVIALSGALDPLVRAAESGLIQGELAGLCLVSGLHDWLFSLECAFRTFAVAAHVLLGVVADDFCCSPDLLDNQILRCPLNHLFYLRVLSLGAL